LLKVRGRRPHNTTVVGGESTSATGWWSW